jgi:hypothetical protein
MGRDDGNKFENGTRNRMWVPENTCLCRLHMHLQLFFPHQTQLHGGNSIRASSVIPKVTPKMSGW